MKVSEVSYDRVKRLKNKTGEMVTTEYGVFRGIKLIYTDAGIGKCPETSSPLPHSGRIIQIEHCNKGRIEYSKNNDLFYFLSEGDLAVHKSSGKGHNRYFPSGHYQGITIEIDLDTVPKCLSCVMEDVNVRPEKIADRFCADQEFFVAKGSSRINHIFAELYHVPNEVIKYSLQGTTQGRYLTGGVPPVRFSM